MAWSVREGEFPGGWNNRHARRVEGMILPGHTLTSHFRDTNVKIQGILYYNTLDSSVAIAHFLRVCSLKKKQTRFTTQ